MKLDEIIQNLEEELKVANAKYAKAEINNTNEISKYFDELGYCEGVVDTLIDTLQTLKRANGEYK